MGRRKIEIQPITHERNRSVTFLKRKNGLFKKAYELGVLCSVDVAVIIFEERPGHELKLHSYSSCDIRDIVQKQIRFQGERDSRGPGDFSGAGAAKFDDDGDDQDDDEEEESSRRPGKRKVAPAKLGMPPDMPAPNTPDYLAQLSHRNGLHMGMGGGQVHYDNGPAPSIGSLMPVSNDRVSNLRSSNRAPKRPRTSDSASGRSRSPSLDQDRLYMHNDSHMGPGKRNVRQSSQIHKQPGPSAMGLQHHQNPYHPSSGDYNTQQHQQYGSLFPIGGPGAMNMGPPAPPIASAPPHFEPQYDPALYQHQYPPSMIRQTPVPALGNRDGGSQPRDSQPQSATQRERSGGENFAAFLEADERSRQMAAQRQQEQLNWPTSTQGNATTPADQASNPSGNQPGTAGAATDSWFDLFSAASATSADAKMTWPRVPQLEGIGAEIAQILVSNAKDSTAPRSASAEGSDSTPVKKDEDAEQTGDDPPKDVKGTRAGKERRMQDNPDEAEKDAEGDDDVVGVDESMETDVPPPTDSAPAMQTSSDENQGQPSADTGDAVDGKAKSKTGKGRSKKATTSSRGRAKAKAS